MPDQNDNPLAFEPINEPIIISKVNNENEQNTLSEMLNRQKKSYDDIQSIKYQLADTGNKSNIFQMIREQRDLSKKINTNISNLTTSIPNAFSHLKNEISQQNDYYRKQENRSYSQNEQIIKKLEQTNDKLEKQITQIDKLKKQENITGITIQPIHQIVQGFSDIKKEIDELKKWRKSYQTMSTGGYTGGSNVTKPQGIVHEGEYVVPQWMVNQNQQIIKQLESIRTQNKNYAVGGYVSNIQDQKTIQALNQLKSQYGSQVAKMTQSPIGKDANTINLQITILSQLLAKDTGGESFEITPQVQNILNYLSSEKIMQQLNPDTQPTVLDMVSKIPEFNKFTNSNNFSKTKKVNELKNEQKQLAGSIAKHKQFSELQKNIGFSNTDDFQYYLQLAFDQIQGMEDPQSSNLFINKFRKFNKILGLQFKPLTSIVESVNALAFKPTDYFGKETDNLVKSFFNLIRNRYTSLDDIRVPSFQTGGYTGQGNPREIQGLVHKDEFVLPSNTKSLWSIFTSTPVNLLKEILYYTKIDQIQSQSQLQIDRKLIAIEDKKYRDYLYDRNKQQKEKQLGSPEEIQLEQQKQQGVSGTAGGFLTGLLGAKLQASLGGIFGIQKGQGAFGNIKNVLSSIQGRVLGGVGGQIQVGTDQYSQYNRSTQIDPITGQKTTDWGNVAQGTVQGSQEGGWLNQLGQQGKYQQLGTQIGGPLGTLVGGGVGLLLGGLGQDRIKQFGEGQQELFTGIKVTEDQINEELQRLQKDPKFQNITEKELRKIQKTEAEQKKNPVVYTIRKGIEYMFNPFKMQGDILNNQFDIQETIDNKYAELKRDPKYKDMSDQQVMELQRKQYKEEHPILSFFSGIQTGISGFISNVWGNIVSIFTGTKNAQDTVNKDIENINNLMKDNNIDFSLSEVTSTTTTDNGLTINTIKGYSQGGFTDNVQPNIPVGVVHGGEYVVPQKLVPKYKPILTIIEKDRQSKLRGYEVGGIVDPPWLTNEPVTDLGNASQGLNELPTETPTQNDTTVKSTITLQGLNELPTETPAQNDTTVKSTITLDDLKKHSTGVIDPRILGALSFAESELNINQVGGNGYGPFQFEPSAYEQAINLGAITNLPHEEQAKNPQWAIKAADLTIQWLLRSKLPRLSEALIGWNRGRGNALNWIAQGSKLEELPKATRGLLMRFINGLDKFLEEDSSQMNQESLSQVEDVLSVATNIINTYPDEAQLALGNISTGDLLSDLQTETPQQVDTTQHIINDIFSEELKEKIKANIQTEKDKLQNYDKFIKAFIKTKLPNTKLTDLFEKQENMKFLLGNMGIYQGTDIFDVTSSTMRNKILQNQFSSPQFNAKQIPSNNSNIQQNLSKYKLVQNTSDLELINFDTLLSDLQTETPQQVDTKQQITKDVFSEELKDKTKTNLPLQDRENLNNSKIGILNYFIPEKTEKMSDVYHFELGKAQNESLLDKIKASYGQYYNTNWIPPGFVEKMFVYDENGNNIIDDRDFVRAITLTPNSFADNTIDDTGNRINSIGDPGRQFYSVWNQIFNDKQQLSQLLDPNLDIRYGETNFEGLPIFITEEKFGMLRNSEIVGNMIPNNYPNSDFYSVFPNSNILSEPKLTDISDTSNIYAGEELQFKTPTKTLPTTLINNQYSKSFNTILKDKIEEIYNQYSNIYPRMYSNNKYTPEQQQIVEWYEDNLIGNNPSKYFSNKDWNKDLEQQQKNVIKSRKDQVEFERKVNKNDTIPYDKYLQGLTEKNIVDSLISKINKELLSQKDVISLLPVNPQHLEDKLTGNGQFNDKNKLFLLLQSYQNKLENQYNSGLIKIDDQKFQNPPQYQWWLNDLAANTGLDSQFDYLNGKVYSQLDEYIYSRFKNRIGEIGGDYDKVNILRDLSSKGIKEKLQYAFGVFWPSKKLKTKINDADAN